MVTKRVAVAVFGVMFVLGPGIARAQLLDHLKCHKVKDPTKLPGTTADLNAALQPEFSSPDCRILKAKYFCVPAAKENVQPAPPRPDITGQGLLTDYVCYTVKCPLQPGDRVVTDQFGTRTQTKYKTSLLCVPAVKGTAPQSTTTTTVVTTTTMTTRPHANQCCAAEQIVLSGMGGTRQYSGLAPDAFPSGATLVLDSGPADPFPSCRHDVTVATGGFTLPTSCINGLFFTYRITTNGCAAGGTAGGGDLWDGGAACPTPQISRLADTSDGVCNPAGQPCNTTPGGAGANVLGDTDATRGVGPCSPAGVQARVDIPVKEQWWVDADGDCPDLDGVFDAGTDTLVTDYDYILTLTTDSATSQFMDENGDACSRAGSGPTGPVTNTGSGSGSDCCLVGQTMTLASSNPIFTGGPPLFDIIERGGMTFSVSACNPWPGAATCTLPNGCMD
ncbi:MAG TPA: hypothetical protein VKA21_06335 [Candidatus Binatia bacterium]|nr:hypothetical protein [Candidatus Binatia bacterium]